MSLIKKQAVLNECQPSTEEVNFWQTEGPTELFLSRADWEDFGCPGVITVTIEPGDLLN